MSRIFISYKRVDKEKVFNIKDHIESALGEKCWIDIDGIESDAQFKNVIIKAINDCEIVLFMYSKAHSKIEDFEKDWTIRELNFASSKSKRIVFVNLDGSPLTDEFVFDYGTKQQVDGQSNDSIQRLILDLSKWLKVVVLCPKEDSVEQRTSEYVHIRYEDEGKWWSRLYLLDLFIVVLWGYFYYHHAWYSIGKSTTIAYILNLLPILFRIITTVQLHRREKTAWVPFSFFVALVVLLWPAGRTLDSFANIIYRPFEYLYLAVNGSIHPGTFHYTEGKIYAGIVMLAVVVIYPIVIYTIKLFHHELSETTSSRGIRVIADYLCFDKELHLAVVIMLCVYFSRGVEPSYSFPKMLYFMATNGIILYFANGNFLRKYHKIWTAIFVIIVTTLCLPTFPFFGVMALLYPTLTISKTLNNGRIMFLYYMVCGLIIPYLLYQSLVQEWFTR